MIPSLVHLQLESNGGWHAWEGTAGDEREEGEEDVGVQLRVKDIELKKLPFACNQLRDTSSLFYKTLSRGYEMLWTLTNKKGLPINYTVGVRIWGSAMQIKSEDCAALQLYEYLNQIKKDYITYKRSVYVSWGLTRASYEEIRNLPKEQQYMSVAVEMEAHVKNDVKHGWRRDVHRLEGQLRAWDLAEIKKKDLTGDMLTGRIKQLDGKTIVCYGSLPNQEDMKKIMTSTRSEDYTKPLENLIGELTKASLGEQSPGKYTIITPALVKLVTNMCRGYLRLIKYENVPGSKLPRIKLHVLCHYKLFDTLCMDWQSDECVYSVNLSTGNTEKIQPVNASYAIYEVCTIPKPAEAPSSPAAELPPPAGSESDSSA